MKKKLIISSIILGLIVLLTGLFWAYKTGKLAGLADVLEQEQYDFGAIISVKYEDGTPAASVNVESCYLEKGKTDLVCQSANKTNPEGKIYYVADCSVKLDPGCPGYSGPNPPEILYTNYRPIKNGYCSEPPYIMVKSVDNYSKINYLDFVLKQDGRCGSTIKDKSTISGFVYDNEITHYMPDETGRYTPIEGARISVGGVSSSNERVSLNTTSKADGTFEINNIPPGIDYDLLCSKDGYGTFKRRVNVAANEEYFYNIGLELPPPLKDKFTLLGKLVNAQNPNEVIADASAIISQTYAGTTYSYPSEKTTADPKINLIAKDIPLKAKNAPDSYNPPYYPYHILISHPEFEVREEDFGFRIEDLGYDKSRRAWVWYKEFSLIPRQTFKVFGNITESMPEPGLVVKDATVIVELYKGTEAQRSYTAKTDKKGNYIISDVAFNSYLLYYFKVEHLYYKKINQGPVQFTEIPKAVIEDNHLEPALKKDFILNPGGIDCKKILGDRCPSCTK